MQGSIEVLVPPVAEPVALEDQKLFLRVDVDDDDDDDLISGLITAARSWCETYLRRPLYRQTLRYTLDAFPPAPSFDTSGVIRIPRPPCVEILVVRYQTQNNQDAELLEGTDFVVDLAAQPARIMPPFGCMWPIAQFIPAAVQIDFVAGYGAPAVIAMAAASAVVTGFEFLDSDVGATLTIPGAGAGGATLTATIQSVDDQGRATLSDAATIAVTDVDLYVGTPVPPIVPIAIKMLVNVWYTNRCPSTDAYVPDAIRALLDPVRDLRLGYGL